MRFYSKAVAASPLFILLCGFSQGQQARAYYNQLYKAGRLDRIAAQYVCFDEDPANQNFFIFATSDALKAAFMEHKQYDSLLPGSKAMFNKGFLYVRGYSNGFPLGAKGDQYVKDGESWLGDPFDLNKTTTGRTRLRVSLATLRYRRSVEMTKDHATHEEAARFGKCEHIPPSIQQNGQ